MNHSASGTVVFIVVQRLYHISSDRSMELVDELELEKDEDAPMSMAANPEVSVMYNIQLSRRAKLRHPE